MRLNGGKDTNRIGKGEFGIQGDCALGETNPEEEI